MATKLKRKKSKEKTSKKTKSSVATAFCMKCQETRELLPGSKVVLLASGQRQQQGKCRVCKTNTAKMVSGDTPYDEKQTKADVKAKQEKKQQRKKSQDEGLERLKARTKGRKRRRSLSG